MSVHRTQTMLRESDHFMPDESNDPHAQRKRRGYLEQIDYVAYAANKAIIGKALGATDQKRFQRMAVAVAAARARWVSTALAATEAGAAISHAQIQQLTHLRTAYEELAEAYDALRRLIERGYVTHDVGDGKA
jgi:hypothetical protein